MANPDMVKGGPSLNPSGLSKDERAVRDVLRLWLGGDDMRAKGKAAYAKALDDGNPAIIKDWADRLMGKVKERVELSEDPDAPLSPHASLTLAELKAVARAQFEREKLPPDTSGK